MTGVERVSRASDVSVDDIRRVFDAIISLTAEGHMLEFRGFGTFKSVWRKSRRVKSPILGGAVVECPSRRDVDFRLSPKFKDKLNEPAMIELSREMDHSRTPRAVGARNRINKRLEQI